jgi:tetratricopeptide (TPR) repeat protein
MPRTNLKMSMSAPGDLIDESRAAAVAAHMNGAFGDAEVLYRKVLAVGPGDVQALTMYGVLAAQTGRDALAVDLLRRAIDADPGQPLAPNNLGIVLTRLGRFEEAVAMFDRAITLAPEYTDAYCNRAVALVHQGRHEEALRTCDTAARLQSSVSLLTTRATILNELNRLEEALQSYDAALLQDASHAPALIGRSRVLLALGRTDTAVAAARKAGAYVGGDAPMLAALGEVLLLAGDAAESLVYFERVLSAQPNDRTALNGAAAALSALLRPEESLQRSELAIAANPKSPDGYINLAIALEDLGRYPEALASIERALSLSPRDTHTYHNRAAILMQLERFDEALDSYDRAIALQPKDSRIRFAKSLCLLLLGRVSEGWPLYESRLTGAQAKEGMRTLRLPLPRWNGVESLEGRTIFAHWEQGLGDTIQFCRLACELVAKGAAVILEVQPPLARLLRNLSPSIRVVTDPSTAAKADCYTPLLSLPGAVSFRDDVPVMKAPYIAAEPERAARWAQRLGNHGFRIGVCWQGSRRKIDFGRSFPVHFLARLADVPGVRLISLQKHDGLSQLAQLPTPTPIETLGPDFDAGPEAFLDTAAVIEELDLVITSDTSVAHLAGAMGRETWIALRRVPDWRWLLERENSPWYPSVRLFRQRRSGDWDEVFERIEVALRQRLRDLNQH